MAQKDFANARVSFQQALEIEPLNPQALAAVTALDLASQRVADAKSSG